jgi:copper chaperone CopZ
MNTTTYRVDGMTCGHCASAVTSELKALAGVADVTVNLNAGGRSIVTVTSDAALSTEQLSGALDEAGNYRLA